MSASRPAVPKPDIFGWILCGTVFVVLGLWWPLHSGAGTGSVLTTCLGGLLVGTLLPFPPLRPLGQFLAYVAGLLSGVAVVTSTSAASVSRPLMGSWFGAYFVGILLGITVIWLTRGRPDPRGAASSRGHAEDAVWMVQDLEGEEVTTKLGTFAHPRVSAPEDAVRRLDGRSRTTVSVFREPKGRLDVGGDAGAAMVVFCSDDRRQWYQVRTPGADHAPRVEVVVGGMEGRYPSDEVTDLESALTAVRTYVSSGGRDEALTWYTEKRGDNIVRPPLLEVTD